VIDPQTQELLQEIVGRESRSLLIYVDDAYPWTTSRGGETLSSLQQLIKEERTAVTALGQFAFRRHIPIPNMGSYPSHFTSYNFIALEFLLPRLVEAERTLIGQLEQDLGRIRDAETRAAAEKLCGAKRRHLSALEQLAASQPQMASV
jgi:hypothetical protein